MSTRMHPERTLQQAPALAAAGTATLRAASRRLHGAALPCAAAVLGACAATPPGGAREPTPIAAATQLVVVTTPGWDATAGTLRRFTRSDTDAAWVEAADAVPIVVGRTGVAWGVGFDHLATASEPRKVEGDGRSPAGAFALGTAFGFDPAGAPDGTRLPHLPLTPAIECVDDTASMHYNRIVDREAVAAVDWRSSERMREVPQYRLGVLVDYNPAAVKGRGSCIFLHVWNGPASTTVGCTALDAAVLARLVAWLDPEARPVLVQLPAAVYDRLQHAWGLPGAAP